MVFIASTPSTSRWTESSSFLSSGAPDSPVHHRTLNSKCPVRLCQPTVGVCSSRPLDPTVGFDRCRLPVGTPDSPVHTGQVLCTVRCATRRWLTALFSGFFADFYGLLLFLSLGLLCIFLCLHLRCCILSVLVQSSLHPVNYKHKH